MWKKYEGPEFPALTPTHIHSTGVCLWQVEPRVEADWHVLTPRGYALCSGRTVLGCLGAALRCVEVVEGPRPLGIHVPPPAYSTEQILRAMDDYRASGLPE